jgi:M6 family metalloprotease-like protein
MKSSFLAGLILLAASIASPQVRVDGERVRGLNNDLLRIHGEMQQLSSEQWESLREKASPILEQRFTALSQMIQHNPGEALKFAFSPELADELAAKFPPAAAYLEKHGTWKGQVERWVVDYADKKSSREILQMHLGQQTFEVHFANAEPVGLKSGDMLEVTGVQVGSMLVASGGTIQGCELGVLTSSSGSNQTRSIHPLTSTMATTSTSTLSCSTTGVQNIAVLMVTFPGVTPPATVTPQSVYDNFFGTGHSLNGYWQEASYGMTSATGDVFGWYTLSTAYTCSTMGQALNEAMAIASAAGVNFQNYTRIFVIYPKIGCVAGFAEVGCSSLITPSGTINASTSYIEADYMIGDQGVNLAAHEGGHNLGLQHAGTLSFGTATLGSLTSTGTSTEFNDYFSVMGSQTLGQYSAPHKAEVLGWLASGTNYQVVQNSGTWTLQPFETSPEGLEALKIRRGTGNNDWLWLEYRQPIGIYDSTLYFQQPSGGAFIHYESPSPTSYPAPLYTQLLDFAPLLSSWYAPAMVAGQTWADPYTNLSISVQAASPTALTVSINYGAVPCTPSNPTVTASPSDPSIYAGNSTGYTLSITNNDSAACPASTFNLSSTQPSSWPTSFSATAVTLSPGQSGSVTMTKTGPSSTAPGTYAVNASAANATNSTYASTGTANVTVMSAPAPTMTITLSTSSGSYTRKGTAAMTATVVNGTAPLSGSNVTFTMTLPDGTTATYSTVTGRKGTATWSYKLNSGSPTGTYSAVAQASWSSAGASSTQSVTSNTVTFSVQ